MNVGLIAVDNTKFPNIPLMKLSAFHKAKGDRVEWYNHFTHYHLVYCSKVFSDTPDYPYFINADKVKKRRNWICAPWSRRRNLQQVRRQAAS